jgi:hypothetical protein
MTKGKWQMKKGKEQKGKSQGSQHSLEYREDEDGA